MEKSKTFCRKIPSSLYRNSVPKEVEHNFLLVKYGLLKSDFPPKRTMGKGRGETNKYDLSLDIKVNIDHSDKSGW